MTAIILAALLAQSPAPEPEVFIDRGETYVRVGYQQGLTKGVTIDIVEKGGGKVVGTAVVMEVWDGLSRVSLDSSSSAFKGMKLARLRGAIAAAAPPAAGQPPPVAAAVPPPPPPPGGPAPVAAPAPQAGQPPPAAPPGMVAVRALTARVVVSGGLDNGRRFIIYNLDSFDWHSCKIALPDGRGYRMGDLRSQADEGIMLFRFDVGQAPRDPQGLVTVRCEEGAGRFAMQF